MPPYETDKRKILMLELLGILFIVLLGSALHFTYDLSGNNPIVGAFSAVNESVWEHLKLAYWPALLYAIAEYRQLKDIPGFFPAKALGIYLMPISIVALFYTYRSFFEESLVIDILIFILAVIIGQLTSYRIMIYKEPSNIWKGVSITSLIVLGMLFILFTFYAPHLPIFQDPISGSYGIAS
ncbi:MAG: DUF6512 family protein [Candidatus Methanomethyliaceae archaeon]|nr:DUF6512 family protein [Candidatus Methanomethyliaceae archaeon]